MTPLITPFTKRGPDLRALEASIARQIIAGIDGIVILDVVGEGQALRQAERDLLVSTCVRVAEPHLRVVVARGTNCTRTTIERCHSAQAAGADALLVTVPYYSKPTLAGTIDHFRQIASSISVPVMVDDDPQMTAIDHGHHLIDGLSRHDSIFGICHGRMRLGYFASLPEELRRRFLHLSRDDPTLPDFMQAGGNGALSPIGNIIPSAIQALVSMPAGPEGRSILAAAMDAAIREMGADDLAALKAASAVLNGHALDVRLPLVSAEPDAIERVRNALAPW